MQQVIHSQGKYKFSLGSPGNSKVTIDQQQVGTNRCAPHNIFGRGYRGWAQKTAYRTWPKPEPERGRSKPIINTQQCTD
jgi:hypothetical protein